MSERCPHFETTDDLSPESPQNTQLQVLDAGSGIHLPVIDGGPTPLFEEVVGYCKAVKEQVVVTRGHYRKHCNAGRIRERCEAFNGDFSLEIEEA